MHNKGDRYNGPIIGMFYFSMVSSGFTKNDEKERFMKKEAIAM